MTTDLCARLLAIATTLASLATVAAGAMAAERVALVIGNSSYAIGPLANPSRDADAVAETFRKIGFDKVILKKDLGVETFRAALLELSREVVGAEVGVIYFAGHGTELAGRNYLIPVDAKLDRSSDLDLQAINLETVINQLEGVKLLKVVVLDACRNNVFPMAGGRRSVTRGLARVEPEDTNTVVSYAAKEGTTADDGTGQSHSPFTTAFLKHVTTPGLEVRLMFGRVRDDVMDATSNRQIPHLYGSLGGREVYLAPGAAAPKPPEQAPAERPATAMIEPPAVAPRPAPGPAPAPAEPAPSAEAAYTPVPGGADSEWSMPTGDYANLRYSKLDQINARNVSSLRQAWTFSTGVLRGHQGNPLVVSGTMYVHTPFPNKVVALDLDRDGAVKWSYEPRQDQSVVPIMCCDTVSRGVAYAAGSVFVYRADTHLAALDAATGKELWRAINGDPKKGESATGAPIVINDKVIVGNSGGEFGVRGHVTAYGTRDGKRLWRAYSVGPDKDTLFHPEKTLSLGKPVGRESSLKTWNGDQWKIGGGTAWGWFSYDPQLNLFYYGTANPSTWNPSQRAGPDGKPIDQKWTNAIIARNPDTGMASWAYQMTPFDEWSYDGVNEMILADFDFSGRSLKALVHFDKNGLAYTMDRATGEPLVAKPFSSAVNWTSGVEFDKTNPRYGRPIVVEQKSTFYNGMDVNTKNICPSSSGAKAPGPAAYSPLTNLFFVPINNLCMDREPFKVYYTPGQPYVGGMTSMFPASGEKRGAFAAWDAATGKVAWRFDEEFPVWGGVLTTAGGLACYGTVDGFLKCRDQKDGKELFKTKVPSGIVGNVMTYGHRGKQYIAAYSGLGGWVGVPMVYGLKNPTDGLGMVGAVSDLSKHTSLGGSLHVFSLP